MYMTNEHDNEFSWNHMQ